MMMKKKGVNIRLFLVLSLALLLVVLVSGFSAHAAGQKRGGTLTVAWPNNPESLYGPASVTATDYSVSRHITDHLIEFDENFNLVPRLAESWSWEDNKTIILKLRKGVKFTDGSPWNSEAAKLNLEAIKAGRFKRSDMVKFIERVEVVDEYTVRLKIDRSFGPFLNNLAHGGMQMVSPEQLKSMSPDQIGLHPIGTGAYVLKEWIEGDRIVLERNKAYWEAGLPYFDKIVYRIVPDRSVRTMMLLGGKVDLIVGLSPLDAPTLEAKKGIEVISRPSIATIYIGLIQTKDIFKDPRVGKALNYAIDRKAVLDTLLKGHATICDSTLPPDVFGYSSVYTYAYKPEYAKELLAQAGYPEGFNMVLAVPRGRYLMDYEIGQYIQAALAKIGVKVKLITWEWGTYIAEVSQGPAEREEDAFLLNCGSRTGHAHFCSSILFHSANRSPKGSNRFQYSDPEADRILDEASKTIDRGKAAALYKRLQQKIVVEDCPWIFLHVENLLCGKKSSLKGMMMLPTESYLLRKAWID